MFNFIKYHSLGNDFIFFDWSKISYQDIAELVSGKSWPSIVTDLCKRHYGIGADGVLILRKNADQQDEVLLFNSDGTDGQKCLNGLRCVAHYCCSQRKYASPFNLQMNNQRVNCIILEPNKPLKISTVIKDVVSKQKHELIIDDLPFQGTSVDVGNPHFVIQQQVGLPWLERHGSEIETHAYFPHKTNVEFVWHNKKEKLFEVLVYERACGITQACGTGAAAVVRMLYDTHQIQTNEKISIKMLGGIIESYVNAKNEIIQQAEATKVYEGKVTLVI